MGASYGPTEEPHNTLEPANPTFVSGLLSASSSARQFFVRAFVTSSQQQPHFPDWFRAESRAASFQQRCSHFNGVHTLSFVIFASAACADMPYMSVSFCVVWCYLNRTCAALSSTFFSNSRLDGPWRIAAGLCKPGLPYVGQESKQERQREALSIWQFQSTARLCVCACVCVYECVCV